MLMAMGNKGSAVGVCVKAKLEIPLTNDTLFVFL